MSATKKIIIVGAGLAGSEAAWQAAECGAKVTLYEMRPRKLTPAHKSGNFAELVCSNSLRAAGLTNAVGVLKEEMRRFNSLIMRAADATAVPAGGALAVDREKFSQFVTNTLLNHENITVVNEEVTTVPHADDAVTIIASGPLTADALAVDVARYTGSDYFYFYDAAAPIVTRESVDMSRAFFASRYDKGEPSYINCPMTREEYELFWRELTAAELAPRHGFDKIKFFEGCMPVEEMARRGKETLLFGPLKPVGLNNPETGVQYHAVVQLRQDNAEATLYNIVGFQTQLKFGEQKRVFSLIPGLADAEFIRYGVMHRNTFINSPQLLLPTMQLKKAPHIFFAGQMTGVEGYVESAATGLMAGINAVRLINEKEPHVFPRQTCHGALAHYITSGDGKNFQPMNVTFGLLPELAERVRPKSRKKEVLAEKALQSTANFIGNELQ